MLLAGAVAGCQTAGPASIGVGRDRYNSIIQSTSMEQTMANIVRVYNHEPTLFLDITEVDATVSFGGSLNGGVTNIGAKAGTTGSTIAGRLGNAAAAVQYSETPTIRYQPLLGQPLVAQMVTPVSVDALGLLYDSYWDVAPLLDFSAAYLTLDYRQFYLALNTINELNHRGALELVAGTSSLVNSTVSDAANSAPNDKTPKQPDTAKKPNGTNNNALNIYLRPFHPYAQHEDLADKQRLLQLWVRMVRLSGDGQPPFTPPPQCAALGLSLDANALRAWDVDIARKVTAPDDAGKNRQLETARHCLPGMIELRVVPLPASASNTAQLAPMMRTYSALGILKNATERPSPKIEFVTPQDQPPDAAPMPGIPASRQIQLLHAAAGRIGFRRLPASPENNAAAATIPWRPIKPSMSARK